MLKSSKSITLNNKIKKEKKGLKQFSFFYYPFRLPY